MRRFGSMVDMRQLPQQGMHMQAMPKQYSMINYAPEGKMMAYPGHQMTLQRQQAPMFAHNMMMSPATLGRDPFKMTMVPKHHHHSKSRQVMYEEAVCCKGHLIVLWIILGVVTLGVISGIILSVTMS